jgi:hypothetical protein
LRCPFDLQVWAVDRMLNFGIRDDPVYEGLELQVFDDPAHGRGMIVLLKRRRDGRLDVYRQLGLTMDPELAQAGGELGAWVEADIDPARFDISEDGVDIDVRLADLAGRAITTGRLPGAWLHRRRLVKYTADPTVVVVNRAHDSPVSTVGTQASEVSR